MSDSLMRVLRPQCVECGQPFAMQADRCPACGAAVDDDTEPTLNIREGAATFRSSRVECANLRRLMQSIDDLECGTHRADEAVAVVKPILDHFKRWLLQMRNVPPAHVAELDDLASMLNDYIPLASRLIGHIEAYRDAILSNEIAAARQEMDDIIPDMERLFCLHQHYKRLGY